jgi:hypothetical protein
MHAHDPVTTTGLLLIRDAHMLVFLDQVLLPTLAICRWHDTSSGPSPLVAGLEACLEVLWY